MIKGRKGRAVAAKQLPPMVTALRAKAQSITDSLKKRNSSRRETNILR